MNSVQKLVTLGISMGAGMLGSRLVDKVWKGFTGNDAPRHGKEAAAEASMRQALGFAIFSAVVASIIQVLADRGTNKAMKKFSK
ncbi:DUF4235 domain-containing protein [Arthrobacter sp. MYb211]|uniref:DUF4235 domain-containing protein n=1 Tax=Micrococcaceae TaxID=1268 RepID=UPI000BB8263C|nr:MULTISPECIES: DUF4235 domain-containing protein [Micrococcaceae]PCC30063.1 hypothetical protein CIK76_02900 [Glutamicibacter sp. BW80]PQZ99620.1 DUF4235 domain-containing protein [Arthrobacter sp. MYb224]PRA05913.1 DUF4235 domain-containing protein [Arthrobacter sp. MYb229]PRA11313.1 DUF4235 domain-containing protein [Arthrobacter sp. MYb221]PRB52814.1 DUF4235 domain-containing protein [Arthrobacter sp. MYb216]